MSNKPIPTNDSRHMDSRAASIAVSVLMWSFDWLRGRGRITATESNLQARTMPANSGRDAVILIDASPSMEKRDWPPSRLDAAKDAAIAYVNRLAQEEPGARVAIVAYAGWAKIICELMGVDEQPALCRMIASIRTRNATNITSGLNAALRLLCSGDRQQQVILLTDGHQNIGKNPKPVADALRQLAIVECVGIGGSPRNVDEKLLKVIASPYPDGRKRYRWIGDRDNLVSHFRHLGGAIKR